MPHRWEVDGPNVGAIREVDRAVKRLYTCADRPPTPSDAPKLSTLPMTAAAREALRLSRGVDD